MTIPEENGNRLVYSNRKRKPNILRHRIQRNKLNDDGETYTLNEKDYFKSNTMVNLQFYEFRKIDSEAYEDSEPTFITPCEESNTQSAEDDDCIICDEPSETIIDLSDEETQGNSNNMIEFIMCDDIEPEAETTNGYLVDTSTSTFNEVDEPEGQEIQQPIQVNFTLFGDCEYDVSPSIDLTTENNASFEKVDSQVVCLPTIDLTDELISDEDTSADDTSNAIIEEIKRILCSKYPGTCQSISRNSETNQLEIEICKNNSFESDEEFVKYLIEVSEMIQKSKFDGRIIPVESTSMAQEERTSQPASNSTIQVEYPKELEVTKNGPVILESNCALNQRGVTKCYDEATNGNHVICLNETSTSSASAIKRSKMTNKTQIVSNYNASQILKKSESYLGVTMTTFERIEKLCKGLKSKFVLILLLRKIKLNESFSILSDVLCPNKEDCISIYKEFLPELSHTLQGFLIWPTNCRDSVAVVDIFEIEIEKPNSAVEQNLSFCRQRQRYIVKCLVCCTWSGYITHISMPFYSIQANILQTCLQTIPTKCSTIVVNPILLNFSRKLIKSTHITTFDCNRHEDRNRIRLVFDRMKKFRLINGILDRGNVEWLQHIVSVVACLCNLEKEEK